MRQLFYNLGLQAGLIRKCSRWYRRAAEQELPNAQFNLAAMYEAGFGVDQDINEAVRWYGKAAAQHHEQAKARIVLLAPHVPAAADALEEPDVAVSDVADTAEPSVEPVPSAQPVVPVVELPAPSEVAAMTQEEATAEKEKVAIAALRPEEPAAEPPSQSQAVAPAVAPVNAPTAVAVVAPVVAPVVAVAVTPAVPVAVAAAYRAQLAAYRSQARSPSTVGALWWRPIRLNLKVMNRRSNASILAAKKVFSSALTLLPDPGPGGKLNTDLEATR